MNRDVHGGHERRGSGPLALRARAPPERMMRIMERLARAPAELAYGRRADAQIVGSFDALRWVPEAEMIPPGLDLSPFTPVPPSDRERPLVAHAPRNGPVIAFVDALGGASGGQPLECLARFEQARDFRARRPRHHRAAMGDELDQPVGGQTFFTVPTGRVICGLGPTAAPGPTGTGGPAFTVPPGRVTCRFAPTHPCAPARSSIACLRGLVIDSSAAWHGPCVS